MKCIISKNLIFLITLSRSLRLNVLVRKIYFFASMMRQKYIPSVILDTDVYTDVFSGIKHIFQKVSKQTGTIMSMFFRFMFRSKNRIILKVMCFKYILLLYPIWFSTAAVYADTAGLEKERRWKKNFQF